MGRNGIKLGDAWSGVMSAHLGTTVAGFPNMFMLLGPNTTLAHSSQVVMIEAQIAYILDDLRHIEKFRRQAKRFDVESYQLATSISADKHVEQAVNVKPSSNRIRDGLEGE